MTSDREADLKVDSKDEIIPQEKRKASNETEAEKEKNAKSWQQSDHSLLINFLRFVIIDRMYRKRYTSPRKGITWANMTSKNCVNGWEP